jgi:asparagine synthase (glutamine-hydrolysing)
MAGGDTVAGWWAAQADRLTEDARPTAPPKLRWEAAPLRAPAWVTRDVVDAARSRLRQTAREAQPLAADRGQHQVLSSVLGGTVVYDQVVSVFAEAGVVLDMPYLDDRVLEAALRVRLHERSDPWQYKPLLAAAMRGIVPGAVLGRSTKGDFSGDVRIGLRRNLNAVLDLFTDSALVTRGMIDPDLLRGQLLSPHADNFTVIALENLLGCETWLRAVTAAAPDHRSLNALPAVS